MAARLSAFSSYRNAAPVPEVSAGASSPQTLVRDYVNVNRPVVLRGAASDWKPLSQFSLEALRNRAARGGIVNRVLIEPLIESNSMRRRDLHRYFTPLSAFLDLLESDTQYVQAYGTPCVGPLAFLDEDSDRFYELASTTKPPRGYQRMRAFFYKNGFTDWHYHNLDETLTTQVAGEKELVLLPPEPALHRALNRIRGRPVWHTPVPELESVQMYRTVLRAGDILYIPVYWWHAAEAEGVGLTVAWTFPSPLHVVGDLRCGGARSLLFSATTLAHWKWLPILAASVIWSLTRRLIVSEPDGL